MAAREALRGSPVVHHVVNVLKISLDFGIAGFGIDQRLWLSVILVELSIKPPEYCELIGSPEILFWSVIL